MAPFLLEFLSSKLSTISNKINEIQTVQLSEKYKLIKSSEIIINDSPNHPGYMRNARIMGWWL